MGIVSIGAVVLLTLLGHLTYMISFFHKRKAEMGFLKSMGFSRAQMLGLVSFEHSLTTFVGIGIGSWVGFKMSGIMVSSVALTDGGQPVLPPSRLIIDWALLAPAYFGLAVIFLVSLMILERTLKRLDLQAIARSDQN